MYIKFIKEHVSGIQKESVHKVDSSFGSRMIDTKFATKVTEEDYNDYRDGIKKDLDTRAEEQNKEGLIQQGNQKQVELKDRQNKLSNFEGFYKADDLVLGMSEVDFSAILHKANDAKLKEEKDLKQKEEKAKEDLKIHEAKLHSMSIEDLKKYVADNNIEVTPDANATKTDWATLVLIAEEDESKKKGAE